MGLLINRAKANTATSGTGSVTPGSAVTPFQSWSGAIPNGWYDYLLEDGADWEVGCGLWNGTTLTRPGPSFDFCFESSTGSLINLSGSATVACVANKYTVKGVSRPSLKASSITTFNASSVTHTFFSGSAVDDLYVIYMVGAWTVNGPNGWNNWNNSAGANIGGATLWKRLSAADIATGSVTITQAGSFNTVIAAASFIGPNAWVATQWATRNSTGATSFTQSSDPNANRYQYALYFSANRANSTDTCNRGTLLGQANDGTFAGCLYGGMAPDNGQFGASFTFSSAGLGYYTSVMTFYA